MKNLVDWKTLSEKPEDYCELCHDTGYYGDGGPGRNNREYMYCDCNPIARDQRQYKRRTHEKD